METKEELKEKLQKIEEQEAEEKNEKRREENYERWLKRPTDYIVGLAHADIAFFGARYSSDQLRKMIPVGISIPGNMGHTYYPLAPLTDASETYMHNVWSYTDQKQFQQELNDLVARFVNKACWSLRARLEMMGLQSNHYFLHRADLFPKKKIKAIEKQIEKAQDAILDGYKDGDFRQLIRREIWTSEDGTTGERERVDLSHSQSILRRYLKENRPKLHDELYKN